MGFLRTLIFIIFCWWIINKALNYYFGVEKKTNLSQKGSSPPFKKSKMDVQDAEFEEVDESSSN